MKMFVIIWAALLFTVRSNKADIDLTQKPKVVVPSLTAGQQAILTCIAPGPFSGSEPEITWMWRGAGESDSHIIGNITDFMTSVTQRNSSTLTFNASAKHHGANVTCKVSYINSTSTEETVTLNVTYERKSDITEKTTVMEGDTLNLTCYVRSPPHSFIMGTPNPSNKNLHNGTESNLQNKPGTATLVIHDVTAEHTGQYTCTSKHLDTNVTVTLSPEILNVSGCINQSNKLACWCVSLGFPVPIIKWQLSERHTELSIMTTVSHHTVNSTIFLTVNDHSNMVVECVSSNQNGEVKRNISINKEEQQKGQYLKFLKNLIRLEVIIGFLTGALLSAIICCLVIKCHRKKQKNYGHPAEAVAMVASHKDLQENAGQAVEYHQVIDQEPAEADVEYSDLEFNLKRQAAAEEGAVKETTETEYAEIKKEKAEQREDGEDIEVLIGEDEEGKHCVPDEGEDEAAALYSTVKDVMDQI